MSNYSFRANLHVLNSSEESRGPLTTRWTSSCGTNIRKQVNTLLYILKQWVRKSLAMVCKHLCERHMKPECCVSCAELLKTTTVWLWLSRAPTHQKPEPDLRGRAWSLFRWSQNLRIFMMTHNLLWTTTQSLLRPILSQFLTQRFDNTYIHENDMVKMYLENLYNLLGLLSFTLSNQINCH